MAEKKKTEGKSEKPKEPKKAAKSKSKTEAKSKPKTETKTIAKSKAKAKTTAKPKTDAKSKSKPKTEAKSKVESPKGTKSKKDAKSSKVEKSSKEAKKEKVEDVKPNVKEKMVKPIAKIINLTDTSKVNGKTKPKFIRQEFGRPKKSKLKEKWRRPKGIDSKKANRKRGKGAVPSIGYKKKASESGIHFGFESIRVFNVTELASIDPSKQAAVIAACVGRKKRNVIIERANEMKITIINPRRGEA